METDTIAAIIELISQITVSAILFLAWRQEREERVRSQNEHIADMRRYADLAQLILEGGRAAVRDFKQRRAAGEEIEEGPTKL